jgi:hypothetical protein
MVIAMIALLVATAGTAYGVKTVRHYPEFNGTDIIDESLTGRDIKNGSLLSKDLSKSVLRNFRGQQGPGGPAGPQGPGGPAGPAGPQGPAGFSKLIFRSRGPLVNNFGKVQYGYVLCDQGYYAVGGGADTESGTQFVNASYPGDSSANPSLAGWGVWIGNNDSVDHQVTVYVVCAPAAAVGKTEIAGVSSKVATAADVMRAK